MTLAPASLQASQARAASFHGAASAFIAAPPSRHGDGTPVIGSGSADQLSRLLLEDGLYKGRQPHQQRQPRRDKATAAASSVSAASLYGNNNNNNNAGGGNRQRHATWAKVHWTPPRPPAYGSGASRRQRTTRLSWSKGQWSRDQAPTAAAATRLITRPAAAAPAPAPVSAFHPQEITKPRLGGVGHGGGAAAAGGGSAVSGGAFTRLSASFAPTVSEPSRPPSPPLAAPSRIRQQDQYRAQQPVSRPAVASATIGSTGPKDLSGAPVEVRAGSRRSLCVPDGM